MKNKRLTEDIPSREAARLLSEPGWTQDDSLAIFGRLGFHAYRNADGRLLITPPGAVESGTGFCILTTVEERLKSQTEEEAQKKTSATTSQHVLKGRLLYGREFANHVPALIERLTARMKGPRSSLDRTEASLRQVDEFIRGYDEGSSASLFSELVAYAGEVIANLTNGEWQMMHADDGETWEPVIVAHRRGSRSAQSNRAQSSRKHDAEAVVRFSPGFLVYQALEDEDVSIEGTVRSELWSEGFSAKTEKQ